MKNQRMTFTILILVLILGAGVMFMNSKTQSSRTVGVGTENNVEIRDGVQYIRISARGGYFPRSSKAKAGVPTKLIVQTDGTYDCSSALVIRELEYQKILPHTGEEEIDLGVPEPGRFQGMCSMGMYGFTVEFES